MRQESKFRQKPFTMIAFLFLLIVGGLHAARIVLGWQVSVGGLVIPLWLSYLGAPFAALLALMLWRENVR